MMLHFDALNSWECLHHSTIIWSNKMRSCGRRLKSRCAFTLLIVVFIGCGGGSGPDSDSGPGTTETGGDKFVKAAVERDMNPDVSDSELVAAVEGNTDFALKAFAQLEPDSRENFVFSPYSITLALALTSAGARGTTLSGTETALSFFLPQSRLHPAFNKLDLLLAEKTSGTVTREGVRSPRLNVSNAIWGQDGFTILPSYLETIALNYGAGYHLVDFIQQTEAARQTINAWVEKETSNKIRDLMPPGSITSVTRIVLTNAIWFKADWASQFSEGDTKSRTFNNHNGQQSTVPFMNKVSPLPYVHVAGCQAVDIPYAGGNLSMLVLMPDAGTFDTFLSHLTPAALADIVAALIPDLRVSLSMPKFIFSKTLDMRPVLTMLGMTDAFLREKADFSGLDGQRDLFIHTVVQKAFISVDEDGTEAAAATGVGLGTTSIPSIDVVFTVDNPFIFMIRDRQTGLILFLGKVVAL